jgi:hypothetical protein
LHHRCVTGRGKTGPWSGALVMMMIIAKRMFATRGVEVHSAMERQAA